MVAAYRITARSLERQLVGEDVLREFESLEDCSSLEDDGERAPHVAAKVVLVLEEDEGPAPASRRGR